MAIRKVDFLTTIKIDELIEIETKRIKEKFALAKKGKGKGRRGKRGRKAQGTKPSAEEDVKVSPECQKAIDSSKKIRRLRKEGATADDMINFKIEAGGSNLSVGQR